MKVKRFGNVAEKSLGRKVTFNHIEVSQKMYILKSLLHTSHTENDLSFWNGLAPPSKTQTKITIFLLMLKIVSADFPNESDQFLLAENRMKIPSVYPLCCIYCFKHIYSDGYHKKFPINSRKLLVWFYELISPWVLNPVDG